MTNTGGKEGAAARELALWAADCAEHVLPQFEQAHPRDVRPRAAVEAARAWARSEITVGQARAAAIAAHAAARSVDEPAARAAARAAGHAAATAHAAGHARHAANYAATAAACSAGTAGRDAAAAREREWQRRHPPKRRRQPVSPDRGGG